MPKKIATDIGCDSFDQLDLQSLNDYKKFLFRFAIAIQKELTVYYTLPDS